jgi:hypothetical protein
VPFTAHVVLTSASDGTPFAKALSASFKAQKEDLAAALTPDTKAQRTSAQQKAISDAFDVEEGVFSAVVELKKAQYLAYLKLKAAGLTPRYNVSGP